jgi:hypothetical protein
LQREQRRSALVMQYPYAAGGFLHSLPYVRARAFRFGRLAFRSAGELAQQFRSSAAQLAIIIQNVASLISAGAG